MSFLNVTLVFSSLSERWGNDKFSIWVPEFPKEIYKWDSLNLSLHTGASSQPREDLPSPQVPSCCSQCFWNPRVLWKWGCSHPSLPPWKCGEASSSWFGVTCIDLYLSSLRGCQKCVAIEEWHGKPLPLFSLQVVCLCCGNIGFQLPSLRTGLSPLSRQFLKRLHWVSDYFRTWNSFFSCPRYDTVTSPIELSLQEEQDVLVTEPRGSHDQVARKGLVLGPFFPLKLLARTCWQKLIYDRPWQAILNLPSYVVSVQSNFSRE